MTRQKELSNEELRLTMQQCLERTREVKKEMRQLDTVGGESTKEFSEKLRQKSLLLDELIQLLERYNECFKLLCVNDGERGR